MAKYLVIDNVVVKSEAMMVIGYYARIKYKEDGEDSCEDVEDK